MTAKNVSKRVGAMVLCFTLIASTFPAGVLAADDAALGQNVTNGSVCICTEPCTTESMNQECPVCGTAGATPENCALYEKADSTLEETGETNGDENAVLTQNNEPASLTTANDGIQPLVSGISYIDADGNSQTCASATEVNANSTTWTTGWYVVNSNVTINDRVTVSGAVHLILVDGYTLTATDDDEDKDSGINVSGSNSLTIYGQQNGTGTLTADTESQNPAIGSNEQEDCGSITINGGTLDAKTGYSSAVIGSGWRGKGGNITINGGTITATSWGAGGAGIGSGGCNEGSEEDIPDTMKITINGGTITATGSEHCPGIGGGKNRKGCSIEINGGTIKATGGTNASGIGTGSAGQTKTRITGGIVTATGGGSGYDIGGTFVLISKKDEEARGVVFASKIEDTSGRDSNWEGIVFEGTEGRVYGTAVPLYLENPEGYTLTVPAGRYLSTDSTSTIINYGTLVVEGTIYNNNSIINYGTIIIKDGGELSNVGNSATFTNNKEIVINENGELNNSREGAIIINNETITNNGKITNKGTINNDGQIDNEGNLTNESTGTINNKGMIQNDGTLNNENTIINSGDGDISGGGEIIGDVRFPSTVIVTFSNGDVTDNTVPYGSTITITATMQKAQTNSINAKVAKAEEGKVAFYLGDTSGTSLGTANVTSSDDTYTATMDIPLTGEQWKPGAYTITADFGGVAGDSGNGLQASTGSATLTVAKGDQTATTESCNANTVTDNSITLNAVTGTGGYGDVQYACVQGTDVSAPTGDNAWQKDTTFNNLNAGSDYTFFARYAGNDYYNPSPASTGTTIYTAYAAPDESVGYSIDYANETVTANDGYEVRLSETDSWTTSSNALSITPKGTFQVRRVEMVGGPPASKATTVKVPDRPAAPTLPIDNVTEGVTISSEYYYNTTSGDYSTEGWTLGNGSIVTVQPGSSIYIYKAAVTSGDKAAFKSKVLKLTAPERASTPTVPTIDYDNETLTGTKTGMEYGVVPYNSSIKWKACTDNMTLENLGWTGSEMTVQFRTAATDGQDGKYASNPTEALTIPARPESPTAPTVKDKTDKSITINTADDVQYQLGKKDQWQNGTDGSLTFDNLEAETTYTIYARIPANSSQFASAEASTEVTTKSSAAEAPAVEPATVTDTTIALPHDATWEYSTDQQNWNDTHEFTGLTAATKYTYYVRVKETDTAEASKVATVNVWTAHAAPVENEGYSIDYTAETLTVEDGYEINTAEDFTGSEITNGSSLTDYLGTTLYIRHKAGENGAPASTAVFIAVPARPAAPDAKGVNETFENENDGKITGLVAENDYEISSDDGLNWKDATLTGTEITGLAPGTYLVRVKGTESSFAGAVAEVTIATGEERTYTLNVTAPTFDSVYTGYTQPEAKAITITSSGNSDATISSVTVSGDSFIVGGSGSIVPAGESITTWTIQPAAGLAAGTHTGTITVTYDNGATATAEVSFVVNRQSSGGGSITYPPTLPTTGNGDVTVSPARPERGDTVTVTVEPDDRYKVEDVTVTDRNGDPVEVSLKNDGTYTFVQPAGKVEIEVTYAVDMPFTDVPEDAWYIDGAEYVYANYIMNGTGETTFGPNTIVSRGMIVQILYNLVGNPDVEGDTDFTDVTDDYWSAKAIAWAVNNGVVNGFEDGTFRPDENMTREQMAAILQNFASQMGLDVSASGDLSNFTDIPEGEYWSRDALAWAYAEGLLAGTSDSTMDPAGQASRAQIAVIMMRFCEQYEETIE